MFWTKVTQKGYFAFKTEKVNTTFESWIFKLAKIYTQFQFELTILIFWTKFLPKRYVLSTTQKMHSTIMLHIYISLGTNFQPKLIILFFLLSNLPKQNSTVEFCIFKLALIPNFWVNWQFWVFGPNLSNKGISSLNQKKLTPLNFVYWNQSRYPRFLIRGQALGRIWAKYQKPVWK